PSLVHGQRCRQHDRLRVDGQVEVGCRPPGHECDQVLVERVTSLAHGFHGDGIIVPGIEHAGCLGTLARKYKGDFHGGEVSIKKENRLTAYMRASTDPQVKPPPTPCNSTS